MAKLKVYRGNKSGLPTILEDGALYALEDAQELYIDIGAGRIKITDIVEIESESDLPVAPLNKFYYVSGNNYLLRYLNGEWIKIGISSYNELNDLPILNSVTLQGELSLEDLGIQKAGDYAEKTDLSGVAYYSEISMTGDASGIKAGYLDGKDPSYYKNIAATYNANVVFEEGVYKATLIDESIVVTQDFFSLRFIAPNELNGAASFTFGEKTYTATNASFVTGQVVFANFNSQNDTVYFSSGSGGTLEASDVTVASFGTGEAVSYDNVQNAIEQLYSKISTYCPFIVSSLAPSDTTKFWVDSGNSGILKYYNGSEWASVVGVWG